MAIRITEDGVVNYENSPDVNRKLFPNLNVCGKEIDKLEEEINVKAPAVFSTTSGSIASFDNGADDMPLKSCVVTIEPIQEGSGDPSPENVRPISGRTGCYISNSNQTYPLVQGAIGFIDGKDASATDRIKTDYIPYSGETSLSFYCKNSKSTDRARRIYWYNSLKEFISSNNIATPIPPLPVVYSDFTPPENATYYRIVIQNSLGTDVISPDGRVLVINPIIISINWETEAGTVYGGTLDVINGKLVVDSVMYNLNTSTMNNSENYPGWKNTGVVDVIGPGVQTENYSVISNIGKTVAVNTTGSGDGVIYLPTQTYIKTQSEWIAEALDVQIFFKSINPVDYQLTPQEIRTLLGESNIWSDAGDVSVDYPADTKTYIDDLSIKTVEVTGQTPTITAEENTRYICGEVTSLSFTPCEKGICDVRFTAASISTVLTLPETVKLPEWFDPALLEAGTTYEINVLDGIYGVVMSWA